MYDSEKTYFSEMLQICITFYLEEKRSVEFLSSGNHSVNKNHYISKNVQREKEVLGTLGP